MSVPRDVVLISDSDSASAVDVLFRSFYDDPTLCWSFDAQRRGYDDRLRCYLELGDQWHRGLGHPASAVLGEDGAMLGVAYLMQPDIEVTGADLDQLIGGLRDAVGDDCARRFLLQNEVVEEASPEIESHLLALVGVVPESQGTGIGSRLVEWTLGLSAEHVGSEGVLLATGTERNLTFYRRLGFEVVAEVDIGDSGELHEWILFADARASHESRGEESPGA